MSTTPTKKILIFGATGTIGSFILQEIYNARTSFAKIGIFTSPSTAETKSALLASWKQKGVHIVVGDISSASDITGAYASYNTVVSALGRSAVSSQLDLLRLADLPDSGIDEFFPSEYGTDVEYAPSSATEPPHQQKLAVRRYAREHVTKLRVTYLVTGPYSDMFFAPQRVDRSGGFDVSSRKAVVFGSGDERISFTTMRDVGVLLVGALCTPFQASGERQRERVVKVNSFTTTPNEVVGLFEEKTGTKWEVEHVPLEEVKTREKEAWEKEDPAATLWTLRRIWAEGGTLYAQRDNGKIGVEDGKLETVEEQIEKAVEKAKGE